VVLEN